MQNNPPLYLPAASLNRDKPRRSHFLSRMPVAGCHGRSIHAGRRFRKMTYNWDLIERLLHEVQNDGAKSTATEFETLLNRGYIEPRPGEEGGDGSNYMLTKRGASLLSLIDSSIPGNDHPRQVLNEQAGDPLDPALFDTIAKKPQIA
ncbi:conserved hypothetical protein [Pseudomonas savastanoi pv. phaseolicola 1448A]|uniref:Transcriptional regulator n=4 Tax=Pseudomonas savastanoi TaxID=29438 RepID=A0A3M3F850_PSESG|nr:conserved hypothetical protein [Pseudomonas savastanoi pv. phaseolicola 1448A]RMM57129.1 hypothetical protein ALQ74_00392 [Pseudomonas savastanoi pv. glycinea]RMM70741.1 hypothetical protein ALQ73_00847 [Pseudomonas savastanoi pv. glycinea]